VPPAYDGSYWKLGSAGVPVLGDPQGPREAVARQKPPPHRDVARQRIEWVALVDVGDVEGMHGVGPSGGEHLAKPGLPRNPRDPSEQNARLGIDRLDRIVRRAKHPGVLQRCAGEEVREVGLVPDLPIAYGRIGAAHDRGDLRSIVGEVVGAAQSHLRYAPRGRARRDPPRDRGQVSDHSEVVVVGQSDHFVQTSEVRRLHRVVEYQGRRDVEADRRGVHRGRLGEHRLHERMGAVELEHRVRADRALGSTCCPGTPAEPHEAHPNRHQCSEQRSPRFDAPRTFAGAICIASHCPPHRSERLDP
jgi:hypothetical protein